MIEAVGRRWSAARRPTRCGWPRSPLRTARDRPLAESRVRVLIVAGEPGGSIPATRAAHRAAAGARGSSIITALTEVGPVSFECWEAPGFLHLNESEYICEVLDPVTRTRGGRRGAGRAGDHESRPHREPGHPLSHRRHRRAAIGAVRVRPDAGPARGRHPRARRRHGQYPRRERLSVGHRVGRAPLRRRWSSSDRRCRAQARCGRCRSRSSSLPAPIERRRWCRESGARNCARRWA